MRIYENAQQISDDLKILKLQRDISIEELKIVKQDFKDDLSVSNWIQTVLKFVGKAGLYKIARKVI